MPVGSLEPRLELLATILNLQRGSAYPVGYRFHGERRAFPSGARLGCFDDPAAGSLSRLPMKHRDTNEKPAPPAATTDDGLLPTTPCWRIDGLRDVLLLCSRCQYDLRAPQAGLEGWSWRSVLEVGLGWCYLVLVLKTQRQSQRGIEDAIGHLGVGRRARVLLVAAWEAGGDRRRNDNALGTAQNRLGGCGGM